MSWAMEELLQLWVHYIPMDPSSNTDIEDKMQWVLDHDKEAQRIARTVTYGLVIWSCTQWLSRKMRQSLMRYCGGMRCTFFRPSQLFRNIHHL
jgi:hypothetical protein